MTIAVITYVDATRHCQYGTEERVVETTTGLYQALRKEFGRCAGKAHVDSRDGRTKHVGWVFVARVPYDDTPKETYLREVWVTLIQREVTDVEVSRGR